MLAALALLLVGASASPAPDYRKTKNWALREGSAEAKPADLFYIHPTTFRSNAWNQDLADPAGRSWVDTSVTQRQASAFADCCRRFMPRYRQASSRAFVERDGEGAKAYDFAYRDVRAAFRDYIAHHNHGRPFIIAGHSQGALHGLRLLREEIVGTPLAKRLVVAYLPGIGIPIGGLPHDLQPCSAPDATGCVVSWNSFTPEADVTNFVARSVRDYGVAGGDPALLCVNPLTFALDRPAGGTSDSKGALPGPAREGALPPLVPGAVSASCQGGVLRVTPQPGLSVEALPGGNLHMNDIAFFWADLKANAAVRAAAWRRDHGARQ